MTTAELNKISAQLLAEGKLGDLLKSLYPKAAPVTIGREGPIGPFFRRPMFFPEVGSTMMGHAHNFDHMSVVLSGLVLVRYVDVGADNKPLKGVEFKEDVFGGKKKAYEIFIAAGKWHQFVALEPDTEIKCYFPHRSFDGEIIADYNGNLHAYS
ncbi:MAG: hypothetical protein ABIY63_13320 [Fibrobacteria bacterium]